MAPGIRFQFPVRQMLEDPLFDLLQIEMIFVEHLLRRGNIQSVLGGTRSGKLGQLFQAGPDHPVLGGGRMSDLQAVELFDRFSLHFFRYPGLFDLFPEFGGLQLPLVLFAQFFLDRLELFPQVDLPLGFSDRGPDL